MSSRSNGWVRATRKLTCTICDGPDNCTASDDGRFVWCGRVESDRQNAGGQWLHRIDDDNGLRGHRPRVPQPKPHKPNSTSSGSQWQRIAGQAWKHSGAGSKRDELAEQLGVSADALNRLKVGWWPPRACWTFPERDGSGNVIGILGRRPDEKKRQWSGSRRGLIYAKDWMTNAGPVLLAEGPSDTAAILSMGMCVVGRPSNTGGIEPLAHLIGHHAMTRELIVIGDNDRKPHDSLKPKVKDGHSPVCSGCSHCWPGRFGAISTAEKLAGYLGRPVDWSLPPDGAKDPREWLNRKCREATDA